VIQITVDNKIRIRGATTPLRAAITAALTVDNPEYKKRKARRQPTWGLDAKLKLYSCDGTDLIVPRGFWESLIDIVTEASFTDLQTEGSIHNFGYWSSNYELSDSQFEAHVAILPRNGILIAPAGSGKTVLGLNYIFQHKRPALWITHTKDLLEQTAKSALKCMPDIGEVGKLAEGVVNWGSGKLIVATVQTLQSNPALIDQLNQFIGTVVVDECHHLPASSFLEVVGQLKARYMLGLTATPDRKDGLECYMYAGIGPKLYEIERAGLYESGRLIKPEIKFIYTAFDYEQASVRNAINSVDAGGEELDYRELLNKLIADEDRLQLIASTVAQQAGYQIVIADSIPYCHYLHEKIVNAYMKVNQLVPRIAVVHGPLQRCTWIVARSESDALQQIQDGKALAAKYDKKAKRWKVQVPQYTEDQYKSWNITNADRKQIMVDAADRKIDILIATGQLVQEGLDLPHLNHGHLTMPKRGDANGGNNGSAVEQAIGRVMRSDPRNPNKQAVWWDYVDHKNGVLKSQYYSRRKVYERLQLKLPSKPKRKGSDIEDFLNKMQW